MDELTTTDRSVEVMIESYQLLRVYGDIEPALIGEPFMANDRELHGALIAHMTKEPYPYDGDDGLFYIHMKNDKVIDVCSFSGGTIDDVRKELGQD